MKKWVQWFLVLMMIGVLLVVAQTIANSMTRQSPAAYANISKNLQLNVTLGIGGNSGLGPNNTVNVTFLFSNLTNKWIYNTTVVNTSQNQTFFQNASFNTALLADGVYNISVNITNSTASTGGSSWLNESDSTCGGCGYNVTIDNTPPNITINLSYAASGIPVLDGSNFSANKGNVSINASVFDFKPQQTNDGLYGQFFNVSTVFLVFSNGTGSEFNRTAGNRSGVWLVNYNLSSLAEGKVSIRVYANDTMNNTNATTTINFTVDKSVPNVTINTSLTPSGVPIQDGSNFSASKLNTSFNVSAFDNVTSVNNVIFWFDNGTGTDFNVTATNVSGVWTANYNVSSLFEGKQGVRIVANDSANNVNDSFFFNFTVDRTAPVMLTLATSDVGSTSTKVTLTSNETVANCTYTSVAGAQGSAGSGNFSVATAGVHTSHTKTFSSLSASTGYQITVTCTDFVGYQVTNGLSWSTSAAAAASSGGSGSGGSGGGTSTGVASSFEKKVWTSINAGETASVTLKNGLVGVTELSFTVPTTVYGAWVHVAKKDSLPSSVSAFSGEIYKIVEITKGPALAKAGAYTNAVVKFEVQKAWLTENKLAKEAVALHRYEGGKWAELASTVGEDDGTYVHYSANTPSFSYFVIGQKSGAVAAPEAEAAPAGSAEEAAAEAPAAEAAMEQKGMSKGLLVALLAAVVVVVAVVLYMRKKR